MGEAPDTSEDWLEVSSLTSKDLPDIALHYAHEVESGVATFDTTPPSDEYWQDKLRKSESDEYPVWVGRDSRAEKKVVGWAGVSRFDPKLAYERTAEFSFYVLDAYQGQGIGRSLLKHALDGLKGHSTIQNLVSRIALQQEASLHLHQSLGFVHIGTLENVGFKLGQSLSVALCQFQLADAS